jgi:protein-glutamine gamma-glutamyltransferase
MTRPAPAAAPTPRPGGAAAAMATALLVVAGAGAWSWPLGGSPVRVAPLAAVAAVAVVVVLRAAGRLSGRLAAGLLTLWLPAAVAAAGARAGQLLPPAWPSLMARLAGGAQRLTTLGSGSRPIGDDPWPLAAWLLAAGAIWVAGAVLAASGPSTRRRAIAFGLLAAPWIAAVAARQSGQAAWQGAAVLLAGLLWSTGRRVAVRPALALSLVAAFVSVGTAQAVGPRERWFTPASLFSAAPPFRTLETLPTYGPLQGRRSGATMLEVTAAEPALWRMQVLGVFVEDLWSVRAWAAVLDLPEPAARVVEAKVDVRGLRNDLVVSPGRIDALHAGGQVSQAPGEAWSVTPAPRRGDTYQVRASVVRATAQQLRGAPAPVPTDARLRAYTDLYVRPAPRYYWDRVGVPLFGQPPNPRVTAALDRTPYRPVAALARQLAAGATTQWDMVARVQRYLLDSDRFRYTTNLPKAGPYPLVGFLLRDHAGYCQHFAGAAALLLRLAGARPGWWPASPPACSRATGASTCATSMRTPGSRCTSGAMAGWHSTPPQWPPRRTFPAGWISWPPPQPPPVAATAARSRAGWAGWPLASCSRRWPPRACGSYAGAHAAGPPGSGSCSRAWSAAPAATSGPRVPWPSSASSWPG